MRSKVLLAAVLALWSVLVGAAPSLAAAAPRDPKANFAPASIRACDWTRDDTSSGCLRGALEQFDADLVKEGYRHARFELPSNYRRLSAAEQLFVLANEDRIARGLAPVAGMDACLDRDARAGARHGGDPDFACHDPFRTASGNWAGANDPLASEFLWVYDDGLGSGNLDCTTRHRSGCWGHRHNVLAAYGRPALMGAADSIADHDGAWGRRGGGEAEEIYGADTARASFTWAGERKYFAHPITAQSLDAALPAAGPPLTTSSVHGSGILARRAAS